MVSDVLTDKLDNQTPGFYFSKVLSNKLKCYERLLTNLIFGYKLLKGEYRTLTAGGELKLHLSKCHEFLKKVTMLRLKLGTLLHICTFGLY